MPVQDWKVILCGFLPLALCILGLSACSAYPDPALIPAENPYDLGEAYSSLRKQLRSVGFSATNTGLTTASGFCNDGDTLFTNCEFELANASLYHFFPPADLSAISGVESDYRANLFVLQDDLFFLPCLTLLAIDAEVSEDEAGYPIDGSYSLSLSGVATDAQAAKVARICGGPTATSMTAHLTNYGEGTVTATITIADASDKTQYDKRILATLDSTNKTNFELLVKYELGTVRFSARVTEQEDCCGGSDTDASFVSAFLASYDGDTQVTRWEWSSPRPTTWTSESYGRTFRALNDEVNGVHLFAGDLSTDGFDEVRLVLGKKSVNPANVALNVFGYVQTEAGGPVVDWGSGKNACIHPTDSSILIDQTTHCEVEGQDTATGDWLTWINSMRDLDANPTTIAAGLCEPSLSSVLDFSTTDFFTQSFLVCND